MLAVDLSKWSDAKLKAATAAVDRARRERSLEFYRPYPKQQRFHEAGKDHHERLFMAGNQLGKTWSGGFEVAMHLTGKYPDWWDGYRFDKPTHWWAAGITSEGTRHNPQRILVGEPADKSQWGTGSIPKADIVSHSMARGVSDALDQLVVKHVSGGQSILGFKSYERGREKWQGETLDGIWFDEEPPSDIYSEGLTRLTATRGIAFITATPLLGMSDVVRLFYPQPGTPERAMVRMEMDDAGHIRAEDREREQAKWPEHEREARARGIPMMGGGLVFAVSESAIRIAPFEVPEYYVQIGGLDFGWDHPTAAVRLAWDRDDDIIYVTGAYRQAKQTPVIHAAAVRAWGNIPWAWPHDGIVHDKGSGLSLAGQYRTLGLNMLAKHATHIEGGFGTEAGVQKMLDYMQTGRFKVFDHLEDWFDEMRHYHRKDGRIVKDHDDLLSATRMAVMMLRHAKPAMAKPRRQVRASYDTSYRVV